MHVLLKLLHSIIIWIEKNVGFYDILKLVGKARVQFSNLLVRLIRTETKKLMPGAKKLYYSII